MIHIVQRTKKKYIFSRYSGEKYYQYWKYNEKIIGNLNTKFPNVSGFSSGNYVKALDDFSPVNSWEMVFKFKTGPSVSGYHTFCSSSPLYHAVLFCILNGKLYFNSYSGSTAINEFAGNTTLQPNTAYWTKLDYLPGTGSLSGRHFYNLYLSNDGITWTADRAEVNSSYATPVGQDLYIGVDNAYTGTGVSFFGGSIDFSESYILERNNYIWRGIKRTSDVKDYNFTLPGTVEDYDYKEKVYKKYIPKRNKLKRL